MPLRNFYDCLIFYTNPVHSKEGMRYQG